MIFEDGVAKLVIRSVGSGSRLGPFVEVKLANQSTVEFNGYTDGGIHTRGIVSDRYKYVYHHHDSDQLFDLEEDPSEIRDISIHPDYGEIREILRNQLATWMVSTGDFIEPSWPA